MTFKNTLSCFKDQLPIRRLIRNFIKGHILGIFSKRSHYRYDGKEKVKYSSKSSAQKAAEQMKKKHGKHFSTYKCLWCDGYHLGKNRENK